jgi:hypothetical protein
MQALQQRGAWAASPGAIAHLQSNLVSQKLPEAMVEELLQLHLQPWSLLNVQFLKQIFWIHRFLPNQGVDQFALSPVAMASALESQERCSAHKRRIDSP